jgi:hypothetical protein
VLPELKRHDVGGDIGVTYDVQPAAQPASPAVFAVD